MIKVTRRSAIKAAALAIAAPAVITSRASAAVTWRMASKQPAESSEGKVYQRFADLAKEYTGGELEIRVYPTEQLGREDAILEQLKVGTVNIFLDDTLYMQKWLPDIKWTCASFLFESRDHWIRFMKSKLVAGWLDTVREKAGIMNFADVTAAVRGPFRVIAATRPVKTLGDVRGLRLRMYPDELANSVWTSLGAETQVLPWTEIYQSIRSGVVQSVTTPIGLVQDMKFNEVAPFITRTDEFFQAVAFMMNARGFERLSDSQKQAVVRAHADAGAFSRKLMDEVAVTSIEKMKNNGATYLELDRKPVIEKARTFYDQLEKQGKVPAGFFAAVEAARTAA